MLDSLQRVTDWIDRHGWATYDPVDLDAIAWWAKIKRNRSLLGRVVRRGLYTAAWLWPIAVRRALNIRPQISAGGVGHLASGYLAQATYLGETQAVAQAQQALHWLSLHSIRGYAGYAWGVPYAWQSVQLLPPHTPLSHTLVTCALPFVELFESTGAPEGLEGAVAVVRTIRQDLNTHAYPHGLLTYAYSPLDDTEVLNTNLDIAWLFDRVGRHTNQPELRQHAQWLAEWVIEEQQPDGRWNYFSRRYYATHPHQPQAVDSYHTGMILRALCHLAQYATDRPTRYWAAAEHGMEFYLTHLFGLDGTPYLNPQKKGQVVNGYGAVQAILCLSEILQLHPPWSTSLLAQMRITRNLVVRWMARHLQAATGEVWHLRQYGVTSHLCSLRWGPALLISALAVALADEYENGVNLS